MRLYIDARASQYIDDRLYTDIGAHVNILARASISRRARQYNYIFGRARLYNDVGTRVYIDARVYIGAHVDNYYIDKIGVLVVVVVLLTALRAAPSGSSLPPWLLTERSARCEPAVGACASSRARASRAPLGEHHGSYCPVDPWTSPAL